MYTVREKKTIRCQELSDLFLFNWKNHHLKWGLQMKLRLRKVNGFTRGHAATVWLSWAIDESPFFDPKPSALSTLLQLPG